MYTVLWIEEGKVLRKHRWDRLDTKKEVKDLLKKLKKHPEVCEESIYIFSSEADTHAIGYEAFMTEEGGEYEMPDELLERIEKFAKMAEEIAGDAPSEEELGDNYELIDFFEEVANVVSVCENLPKKKT